jgi:hypothetical protein
MLRYTQALITQISQTAVPTCWEDAARVSPRRPRLQKAGLIRYVRGHITILDRHGLEAASCECYQVVKTEFDGLLG